jgi:probable DNA repair protein
MPATAITKSELLERLARGRAARVTVVTPNLRLSQVLRSEFDAFQAGKGLSAWEDADILPFGAFLERLYEDALCSGLGERLALLVSDAQESALWEGIVGATQPQLLDCSGTASRCADAWRLAHAWRIDGALGRFPGNEDHEAFATWARAYREKTAGATDRARLPDLVQGLLPQAALRKPAQLVAYAFDILPPQTKEFFEACEKVGIGVGSCIPARVDSRLRRTSFKSPREELEAAARWSRTRLEQGANRIGVVVPELQQRRKEVVRVFSRAMRPGFDLPGAPAQPMPFDVSLGEPLSEWPLVNAALCILDLAFHEIDFSEASRLIRSPFLGGAESEMTRRARLDAELRKTLPARLTLAKLIGTVEDCPVLRLTLEKIFDLGRRASTEKQSPRAWAERFSALLEAAGFPGERALDSAEFQARAKLFEVLREFANLERFTGPVTCRDAISRLRRLCSGTLFQPESPEAPVRVLGILESAGLELDHLWVSGMTEDAWPLAARPNPFVPLALQRKAGIPEAAAETSLALDRRLTEGWTGAAAEVVFSFHEKNSDRKIAPSPLIAQIPEGDVPVPSFADYRDLIFESRKATSFTDETAPPVPAARVRGGTRVLADQAACPFRAFARWRLKAETLEAPAEGPDAMARGLLLHDFMKRLWGELKASQALDRDIRPSIEKSAFEAVREAGLEGRFAELERARLARIAAEWLDLERQRGDFEVVAREERREITVSNLVLSGRIDRMDRLPDGSHLLIDYKTGSHLSPQMWMDARPDEPQLPLYAVSAKEDIGAVAFAKVRAGDMKFMGFSRAKNQVPGVKQSPDWKSLFSQWRTSLEALASGFAAGDAQVDPKHGLETCRNCDLQPLCRVHERLSPLSLEGRGAGGEGRSRN